MAKKTKIFATPISGWVLLSREETYGSKRGDLYIAWNEVFDTKDKAERFATENGWPKPWRAVRGNLTATFG